MNILLTGGSGDVGTLLTQDLLQRGDGVTNIDLVPPKIAGTRYVEGSITDRALVARAMEGIDTAVHIAAWHGVHEDTKSPADFHDLNVTGTFNVLQAAVEAGVKRFIFISSTSVDDRYGLYGNTKILGEEMVRAYAERYPAIDFLTLRPRAFIPSWNRVVYRDFLGWAEWFMKGAVHIDDFRDAILIALDLPLDRKAPIYVIDGAYEYSAINLKNWSAATFAATYPDFVDLARSYNLDTARKPKVLDIPSDQQLPGYRPKYSLRNLLEELRDFGPAGPPAPFAQ